MLSFQLEQRAVGGRFTRRDYLRLTGAGTLAAMTARAASAADSEAGAVAPVVPRAKSVIVVFTSGGQSQLDLWDPKPDAPAEVRGDFRPIATSVPGTFLGEHLPRLARLADRYTLVRTMSHQDLDHGSAVYLALTGRYHAQISSNPAPKHNDQPAWMSVLKRVRPDSQAIDTSVLVNGPVIVAPQDLAPGQNSGLLGRDYEPLVVGNVNTDDDVVPGLATWADLPAVRIRERDSLVAAINRARSTLEQDARVADLQGRYRRALELLEHPATRRAFDLAAEPEPLRRRYGRHRAGQACLLARRLVEAGVPLITVVWNHQSRGQDLQPGDVDWYGWDTHNDIFDVLRSHLLPRFDQSFSALLEDLEARGLLDETLVICMGEFGRAPLVALEPRFAGVSPGRKHWAAAYSVLMAGAGVARGSVVGKTDRLGAYPASDSYGPWDLTATIFSALGVDPAGVYYDRLQRPLAISIGTPIRAAYSG